MLCGVRCCCSQSGATESATALCDDFLLRIARTPLIPTPLLQSPLSILLGAANDDEKLTAVESGEPALGAWGRLVLSCWLSLLLWLPLLLLPQPPPPLPPPRLILGILLLGLLLVLKLSPNSTVIVRLVLEFGDSNNNRDAETLVTVESAK
jgi:hypothetical protein